MRLEWLAFPALLACTTQAQTSKCPPAANHTVRNWLYSSNLTLAAPLLERPDIDGIQLLYSWASLEPSEGVYNWTQISADLSFVQSKGKMLWVQLQDRSFFLDNYAVPTYMRGKPEYSNGSVSSCDGDCSTNFTGSGWAAAQWNENVRARYQNLLSAMAEKFDGKIYGMNFPETSIQVQENMNNYTSDAYFHGTLDNAKHAAEVFQKSYAVQYVNFWPDDVNGPSSYLNQSFAFFANNHIGIGGPDDIPYSYYQEQNSYPLFDKYRNKVPISVIAVQEPDLRKVNPDTGKPFTKQEFTDFAVDCLGSKIMFWALTANWLKLPSP